MKESVLSLKEKQNSKIDKTLNYIDDFSI